MASEAAAKRVSDKSEAAPSPAADAPLFAPLRDLNRNGRLLIGGLILLANIPLIHYFVRHVLTPWPTTTTIPFTDDFNRDEIGPNYWYQGGDWRIESGELHAASPKNNALWLQAALPSDVAVDFDVRGMSQEGEIRFELFGDGFNPASGYLFGFGAQNNQLSYIGRLTERGLGFDARGVGLTGPTNDTAQAAVAGRSLEELFKNHTFGSSAEFRVQRGDLRVQVGATYHMHIERRGGDLKWYVNDQLALELNDPMPLAGKGHDRFGFSEADFDAFYDNLSIRAP